jgi:hypothetical protein
LAGTLTFQSFYQNSGGICHGLTSSDENKLERSAQRLRNKSNGVANVACNLMSNERSVPGAGTFDVIPMVTLWAHRYVDRADNTTLSCDLITSFATDVPATGLGGNGIETINITTNLPPAADPINQQVRLVWFRNTPDLQPYFRAPANIVCALPPKTELHDTNVLYGLDIGS